MAGRGRIGGPERWKTSRLLESAVIFCNEMTDMIELNPIRQRIADLQQRLLSLRGYL